MESDIYGNTALPLAPDLQNLQAPQVLHFHDLGKSFQSCLIVPHITKILQNFWLNLLRNFFPIRTSAKYDEKVF